jgi:hypothetical protein
MSIVETGNVFDAELVKIEIAVCFCNAIKPRLDPEQIESNRIALPFIRAIPLRVHGRELIKIREFLIGGQIGESDRRAKSNDYCKPERSLHFIFYLFFLIQSTAAAVIVFT